MTPTIRPFGQNVIAQVATAAIANNPAITKSKEIFKSDTNVTKTDDFVSSKSKEIPFIGGMSPKAAAILGNFANQDVTLAGGSPSFVNRLINKPRDGESTMSLENAA